MKLRLLKIKNQTTHSQDGCPEIKNNERGFSLIELLIVLIILGLLAALVVPRFFGHVGRSKLTAAKMQIELFGTALDAMRLDIGRYPAADEGLQLLRVNPGYAEGWRGPYLPKDIPLDPWKRAYVYISPSEHGEYEIISYGADGVAGGSGEAQDIVNWKDIEE